ncbi:MAG: LuxR C-terminal-related transcriptional regulator [Rhodococcus sp. (in: high G+C Gram-positive bacteria)]|uniref:LuxR C-terminal-related transcriptional regulator n=1 Tax=Rhodococcus sp. TaxID=1831 RepID=UPI003BB74C7C
MPRPRLFRMLDEQRSLTVVQAPNGFGKRTLVASWLHRGGAAERTVIWLDGADATQSATIELSGDAPSLVVVDGVDPADAPFAVSAILDLLERNPAAIAVVTVHGAVALPPALTSGSLGHCVLDAQLLCFTVDETEELFRSRGSTVAVERRPDLCSELSGVPPLVAAAVAMLGFAPVAPVTTTRRLVPALDRVVSDYVDRRLSALDDPSRRFALKVSVATGYTARAACDHAGDESAEMLLEQLDRVGLVLGTFDGAERYWSWPPAVRGTVLAIARADMPGYVDDALMRLAREHRDAGRHAAAASYAVDAGWWDVAAQTLDEHWSDLIVGEFELLVRLLRAVPDSVADAYPGLAAGKALFVNSLAGNPMLGIDIPCTPDELDFLGARPEAPDALHVGTVQAVALRLAGSLREASDRAQSMVPLVESMLVHQPDSVTAQLPTIRLQWAIGMQLAGDVAESTVQFEQAHRDALPTGHDFVVLNAAGSLAANWALLGDLARVDEWLAAESHVGINAGYWDDMIRVGGRVAAALASLDRLDPAGAEVVLDQLGVPTAGEELWGMIAYVHAQYALTTGDAYAGLTSLHRIVDGHRGSFQHGAIAHILLTAAEIDLNLVLGRGNTARALAEADTTGHPVVVVSTARTELLTGNPEVARAVLNRISWPDSGWLRAHLEALLIEAVACSATDRDIAVRAWSRATKLASELGNRRVLTTVPAEARRALSDAAGAVLFDESEDEVFPDSVREVVLTAREREILVHLDNGVARKDLASVLFVSNNTIKTQLRRINVKLGTGSAASALARAREIRLLS